MERLIRKANNKGQALLEFIILIPTVILFFTTFIATIYLITCNLWAEHHIYESLICVAEGQPIWECEKEAKDKIEELLIFSNLEKFKITKTKQIIKGELCLNFKRIKVTKQRKLHYKPLLRPAKITQPQYR